MFVFWKFSHPASLAPHKKLCAGHDAALAFANSLFCVELSQSVTDTRLQPISTGESNMLIREGMK
jgi:hypothetical protein